MKKSQPHWRWCLRQLAYIPAALIFVAVAPFLFMVVAGIVIGNLPMTLAHWASTGEWEL